MSNQPIEEKWKIDLASHKLESDEGTVIPLYVAEDFIENLIEQERMKLAKQIDSFPLSDSMFFDENNWKAGYKALEEFKQSIINK